MFCGTDSILQNNPHIQFESGEYFPIYCQSGHIFLTFSLNVRNISHNIVSPTEHWYGYE